MPIGASAALAAAFNTPIAAVLFTLEEVMGDLHAPVLGSIVLSSATSWIVLHLLLGDEPLFHAPAYQLVHPIEFFIYAILGVTGGLVSVSFVKLLLWLRRHFLQMPRSTEWLQPAAGGLAVGLLGWFAPAVLGVGYGNVGLALNGKIVLSTMAILAVLKVVATAACYASGNAGGIFGPALFMGAMTGGALGGAAHMLLPDFTGSVGAYALVGMGACFAGIIRVPLTSVIMIFEITRDYSIIVPLMIANLISYFISSRLQEEPIYEALQHQDGIHLPVGARGRVEPTLVSRGLRPASVLLRADDTVDAAAAATGHVPGTWVVLGRSGVVGLVTTDRLEQALKDGQGQSRIRNLLSDSGDAGAGSYPYVHADDSLDTALRRLADSGFDTLPVVSRADIRDLVGVISLQDILSAYGFGEQGHVAEEPTDTLGAPVGKLIVAIAVIAGMLLLAVTIGYVNRSRRLGRATRDFQTANELAKAGRYAEAVEQYRNALSISQTDEHRLGLALALVKTERFNEAELYLREVLRDHPTSGPANEGLAEVNADEGRIDEAVRYYHRAQYGSWPSDVEEHRIATHLALIQTLGKAGRKKQAQAELLSLVQEHPSDPTVKKKVAEMLLGFDLPQEAAEVFESVVKSAPDDKEAYVGLAKAEAARWNYALARDALRGALRVTPKDQRIQEDLAISERVLALDPTLNGLRSSDRFKRSQALLESTVSALDQCAAGHPETPFSDDTVTLANTARRELASRRRPKSYADSADQDLAMARQIWSALPQGCRIDKAVNRVMAHLTSAK